MGAYYAGTHDGLPIIGVYDEYPNCYFVYAYGDNEAVYSMVLAKCLRDWIALPLYVLPEPKSLVKQSNL
ncbi:hypothetical protein GsuE55_36600 [Geobacillus subterraneus]|uniref:Uncharacterized protein n=2 Tax=Geobacillus TaxID=129337 RepID=A0A7U9JDK5_GEOTM|nr:hypothetical protein T260_02575 [Geobacillus sp. MAS1]KYD27057.1 hypothetical protein B4113_0343 [Geobacillus sp. B4113_201601]BBW98827.1 hypothetical protein GsuE55_36600 [Geobacillus subterraneus]